MGDDEAKTKTNDERAEGVRQKLMNIRTLAGRSQIRRKKRKRPDSVKSHGTLVEQPSPEVCSPLLYVVIAAGGMARKGESYGTIW